MIQNFKEVETKLESIVKMNDYYSIYTRDGRDIAPAVREETASMGDKRIVNYKDSILFTKRHDEYVEYRKMDMKLDTEIVELNNANAPTICDLNFEYETIGSDETGTGEIFKPMVVVATYLKDAAQVENCIKMGVTDSKKYKNNPERIYQIAEAVTGINKKEWDSLKNQKLIVSDFYAIRIVSNEELNLKCEEQAKPGQAVDIDGAKETLLKEAHVEVLNALYQKHNQAAVVIDDFTEEIKRKNQKEDELDFRSMLKKEMNDAEIYLTTKGDAKVMSVALGSMISYYISYLGLVDAEKEFIQLCKEERCKFPAGAWLDEPVKKNENKIKFKDCIDNISTEEFKAYMNKYAKRYYSNVIDLMKKYC